MDDWLPADVHFGYVGKPLPSPELSDDDDDDEELEVTPPDVVEMLGFDPAEDSDELAEDAAPAWYEQDHKRDKGGQFAKSAGGVGNAHIEGLHKEIQEGIKKGLGNKSKKKLGEIGNAHKGKVSYSSLTPLESPSTPLHHTINKYIAAHQTKDDDELEVDDDGDDDEDDEDDDDLPTDQPGDDPYYPAPVPIGTPGAGNISSATLAIKKGIDDNLDKMVPMNAQVVKTQMAVIDAALQKVDTLGPTVLGDIKPITYAEGVGQQATNNYLASLQKDYGVTPKEPPKYGSPEWHQQIANWQAKEDAKLEADHQAQMNAVKSFMQQMPKPPHKHSDSTVQAVDSKGQSVTASFKASTKDIPGDFYHMVTAVAVKSKQSLTAVDPAMDEYSKHTYALLSDNEKKSASAYQDGAYDDMNKAISGLPPQPPGEYAQKHIDNMKSAIEKAPPVPADLPVFRGIRSSLKDITGFDDPNEAVGKAFEHKNFASVSRSRQKARGFSGGKTMMVFTLPAGAKGLVMPRQSWEREIVLHPNALFRIDKVVTGEKPKHVIHCTYLGEKNAV